MQRYLSVVRGVCSSYEREPGLRDDLVQEAFIDAFRNLHTLRDHSKLGAWLAQIARRRSTSWVRHQTRRNEIQEQLAREQVAPSVPTPLTEATQNEVREWILTQVQTLPHKTREAISLFYFEGMSTRECATYLNVSESSVKKRLQYGRQLLGHQLTDFIRDTDESDDEQQRNILAVIPFGAAPWLDSHAGGLSTGATISSSIAWKGIGLTIAIIALGGFIVTQATPKNEPAPALSNTAALAANSNTPASSPELTDARDTVDDSVAEPTATVTDLVGDLEVQVRLELRERNEGGRIVRREGPPVHDAIVTVIPFSLEVPPKMLERLRKEGVDETEFDAFLARLRDYRSGGSSPFQDSDMGQRVQALAKDSTLFPESVSFEITDESAAVEARTDKDGIARFDRVPAGNKGIRVQIETGDEGLSDDAGGTYTYVEAEAHTQAEVLAQDRMSIVRGSAYSLADGLPVEGLSLRLRSDQDGPDWTAQTKEDGRFVFPYAHLSNNTDYQVTIDDDQYYGDVVTGTTRPGRREDISIRVYESGSISGVVRYADGRAVVGAAIHRKGVGNQHAGGVRSDTDGTYELFHEGGQFQVYASRLGVQSDSIPLKLARDESANHDFVFPNEPSTTFRLAPATVQPLGEDTRVYLMSNRHTRWQSATNDFGHLAEAGHFSFTGPEDDYVFRWYAKGFNPVEYRASVTSLSQAQQHTIEFTPATEELTVIVFDQNGNRSKTVEVYVNEQITDRDGSARRGPFTVFAQVRADGTASFKALSPGTYEIQSKIYGIEAITLPYDGVLELHPKSSTNDGNSNGSDGRKLYFMDRDDFFLSLDAAPHIPLSLDDATCLAASEQGLLLPCEVLLHAGRHEVYWIKSGYTPGVVTLDLEDNHRRASNELIRVEIMEGGTAFGVAEDSDGLPLANTKLYVYPATTWDSLITSKGMKYNRFGHILA